MRADILARVARLEAAADGPEAETTTFQAGRRALGEELDRELRDLRGRAAVGVDMADDGGTLGRLLASADRHPRYEASPAGLVVNIERRALSLRAAEYADREIRALRWLLGESGNPERDAGLLRLRATRGGEHAEDHLVVRAALDGGYVRRWGVWPWCDPNLGRAQEWERGTLRLQREHEREDTDDQ